MADFKNLDVRDKFDSYPIEIKKKILSLRSLILASYDESQSENVVTECLKWGEPSYTCKAGSTIRIDWKPKDPNNLHVYFNCKSKLIETFREIYGQELDFESNRIILLPVDQKLPKMALIHCFTLALNYHKIKHLPLLGA
ncbi:MAG: DUF1801 domain-containing protein [Kangiellaceae bacterium]